MQYLLVEWTDFGWFFDIKRVLSSTLFGSSLVLFRWASLEILTIKDTPILTSWNRRMNLWPGLRFCRCYFYSYFSNLIDSAYDSDMPKFGVRVWGVFGRGGVGWRFGAGGRSVGGGWLCVLCVVFDVLFCVLTKCFFRVFALFLCCLLSFCCRLLWGEFIPLLCLLAWLAVAFGLVRSAPQSCGFWTGFLVRVPTSWECVLAKQEGSLKFCAHLWFQILRFFCLLVCSAFFGLICCAPHSFGFHS